MVQVASVSTNGNSLRSEIFSWKYEDSDLLVRKSIKELPTQIFIGYTPGPKDIPLYGTILEMLADGWEILGPPVDESWTHEARIQEQWGWWLTRPTAAAINARKAGVK